MFTIPVRTRCVAIPIVALIASGCQSPWLGGDERFHETPVGTAGIRASDQLPKPSQSLPPANSEIPADAVDPAILASVMDKLQQINAIDPTASQKLLTELQTTPPKLWPATAEQFRSSLAYHEQLIAREKSEHQDAAAGTAPIASAVEPGQPAAKMASSDQANVVKTLPAIDSNQLPKPHVEQANFSVAAIAAENTPATNPAARESLAPPQNSGASPSTAIVTESRSLSENHRGPAHFAQSAEQNASVPLSADGSDSSSKDWRELVNQAADSLAARVADSPASTAEVHQHVTLRILRLLSGDTEGALEPIPHISPTEQDYWSHQIFALATYLDHHTQPDDMRRAAASAMHLDEALTNLRDVASLTLRNFTICKKVYGYGVLDPYTDAWFVPGQSITLYVEVENYHSRSSDKGYSTLLSSSYELFDEDGKRVAGDVFPDVADLCRSRRRDFHVQYSLALPQKLIPGRYRLQLVVHDRQTDEIANSSVDLEVQPAGSRDSKTEGGTAGP